MARVNDGYLQCIYIYMCNAGLHVFAFLVLNGSCILEILSITVECIPLDANIEYRMVYFTMYSDRP